MAKKKTLIWGVKEMLSRMPAKETAILYIKMRDSEYDTMILDLDAYHNAMEKVRSKKYRKEVIDHVARYDANNNLLIKEHKKLQKRIEAVGKGYDAFQFTFDDILYDPKDMTEEVNKKIDEIDKKRGQKYANKH